MKALVQSVGTGARRDVDITKPLMWQCRRSGAGFFAWVVSDQSRELAHQMAGALKLSQEKYEILVLNDGDIENVERTYRKCLALLRDLARRGFAAEDIEVGYTSGTKAMTAGLTLAAVAHRCATLSYITGDYDAGIVIDGTERLVSVEPRWVWADERIRLAIEFCRELNFAAANRLLESLVDSWLGEYERQLRAAVLVRSLLRRIGHLSYFHCGGDPSTLAFREWIDLALNVQTVDQDLTWFDWERYSSRQHTHMRMGGLMGRITFEGNLAPFYPLLDIGEITHGGKGTSFGLGRFRVSREQTIDAG